MFQRLKHGPDRGAVAVEFALVVPVLLLILLGIIDFGRAMFVKNTLAYSAAQAARASAVHQDTSTVQALAVAAATNAGVQGMAGSATSPTFVSASYRACPADAPGAADTATSSVTLQQNFKWILPLNLKPTISATATWLCVKTA